MGDEAALGEILRELRRIAESRLAERVVPDADAGQRCGRSDAGAECLAERFLGGEAFGEKTRRVPSALEVGALFRRQQLFQPVLAVPLIELAEPRDGDDIGADAEDRS